MTTPAGMPELYDVIDAGFGVAIRLKRAIDPNGPSGKQVTLDELLDTVTDGKMREATRDLVDAIEDLINKKPVDAFALIPVVVTAILDWLSTLRIALEDRKVDLNELLHGVTDGELRPELEKAIQGIDKIPSELKGMDMMKMFGLFQRISAYLPQLLAGVA